MLNDPDYLKLKEQYARLEAENRELNVRLVLREADIRRLQASLEEGSAAARFEAQIGVAGNGG